MRFVLAVWLAAGVVQVLWGARSDGIIAPDRVLAAEEAAPARRLEVLAGLGGYVRGLAVTGQTVFHGEGTRLVAEDVSDPAAPFELGRIELATAVVADIALDNRVAYVATMGRELAVVDVSDPAAMRILGAYRPPPEPRPYPGPDSEDYREVKLSVRDGTAYMAIPGRGLDIFDVSDPSRPASLSSVGRHARDVAVGANGVAYVAGEDVLTAYDVTDPRTPFRIGSRFGCPYRDGAAAAIHLDASSRTVFVVSDYAFYAFELLFDGVPSYASTLWFGASKGNDVHGMSVDGGFAYVSANSGLWMFDVHLPRQPVETAHSSWSDLAPHDVTIVNGLGYVTEVESGIAILDISDPERWSLRCKYSTPLAGYVYEAHVVGRRAFVVHGFPGQLSVLDADDADRATVVGDLGEDASPLFYYGGRLASHEAILYALSRGGRIYRLLDTRDTSALQVREVLIEPGGDGNDVAFSGRRAYVTRPMCGQMAMYDLDAPDHWEETGKYPPGDPGYLGKGDLFPEVIATDGDTLYALAQDWTSCATTALLTLDLSVPDGPAELGRLGVPLGARSVFVVDPPRAYAVARGSGMAQFDIGDPERPRLLSRSIDVFPTEWERGWYGPEPRLLLGEGQLFVVGADIQLVEVASGTPFDLGRFDPPCAYPTGGADLAPNALLRACGPGGLTWIARPERVTLTSLALPVALSGGPFPLAGTVYLPVTRSVRPQPATPTAAGTPSANATPTRTPGLPPDIALTATALWQTLAATQPPADTATPQSPVRGDHER